MIDILIIDDDIEHRTLLAARLSKAGYRSATKPTGSLRFAAVGHDLVLINQDFVLKHNVSLHDLACPALVVTRTPSIAAAVSAMKRGATDYLPLAVSDAEFTEIIERVIRTGSTQSTNVISVDGMLGNCPAIIELSRRIRLVAPTNSNVLIEGESGTGKELVAKAIHKFSERAIHEMISLNCAAIPETLIESELFGHEKGSFTGAIRSRIGLVEAAHGSTLFLDEIGELPLDAQARLLRVLQEGEIRKVGSTATRKVDVRLITATNRNLKELTFANQFRDDLYYRLNVLRLNVPPLRDRGDDLQLLAQVILDRNCRRFGKRGLKFSTSTWQVIRSYSWPGNIRELENAIEQAVVFCEDTSITPDLLAVTTGEPLDQQPNDQLSLDDYFRQFVLEHQDRFTETELAARLGISRKSLWKRRQRFNLPRHRAPSTEYS